MKKFKISIVLLILSFGISKAQVTKDSSLSKSFNIGISLNAGVLLKSNSFYSSELFNDSKAISSNNYIQANTLVYFQFKTFELEIGGGHAVWKEEMTENSSLSITDNSFNFNLGYLIKTKLTTIKPFVGYSSLNSKVLMAVIEKNSSSAADYFNSKSNTNLLYLNQSQIKYGVSFLFDLKSKNQLASFNSGLSLGITAQYNQDLKSPVWSSSASGLFDAPNKVFDTKSNENLNSLYLGLVLRVDLISKNNIL